MSIYDKASLVLIPSGTKTSKVYSQKPTNGDGDFTFSRSTAATRVNASGNIEKETSNLLLQSNAFTTTWTTSNAPNITSGQSGYDGTSDAWKIELTAAYGQIIQSISISGLNCTSIYAKAGTIDFIRLRIDGSPNSIVDFNLTDGSTAYSYGNVYATSTSVGGGWYRLSMVSNVSSSTLRIYPLVAANDLSGTSGYIYIQDAQLEQGLVARSYNETTTSAFEGGITDNVPRLDYTDSSCPALLLEPQRTNLITNSEHLESSYYGKTRCTIEDNSTTSPEGVINASKMTSTDASESYIQGNVTTTGTKMSWSFFAKKGDLDYCHGLVWSSPNGCRQWFNLSTGAVGGTTTFGSGYSVDSASIEDYGNGWYRCTMIVNCSAGTQGCRVNISSADTTIGSAVNSYGYFYGLQAEDASYATSYIPTYGSAVTRNRDYMYVENMQNDIMSGATEASLFLEFTRSGTGDNIDALRLHAASNTNGRAFLYNNAMGFANDWSTGSHHNFSLDAVNKSIWRLNSLSSGNLFLNGSKALNDDTGTAWANIGKLEFNGAGGILRVHTAYLIKEALTDAECIDLTT